MFALMDFPRTHGFDINGVILFIIANMYWTSSIVMWIDKYVDLFRNV